MPIISDKNMRIAKLYNMIHSVVDNAGEFINSTARSLYIISPDKKISLMSSYPVNTGRNFTEILRTIDSLVITNNNNSATPANWSLGEDCVIAKREQTTEKMLGHPKSVSTTINSIDDIARINGLDLGHIQVA